MSFHMKATKKLIMLLAMLACMGVSAQDTVIDETCPPQFPGGDAALINFLNANIVYPQQAAQDKVEGKVIVQFTVKKTGKIDNVKVLRSVRKDLDDEAVRVVKMMPDFIPAKQNGEVADMPYTIPVSFKLFDEMEPLTVSEGSDVPEDFQPPMFPGGERAAKRKTQGRVVMTFVVDKTGKVTEIKVAKSVDIYLDTEAIRVCKLLPDFIPARQNGEPVSVWFTLPITFKL